MLPNNVFPPVVIQLIELSIFDSDLASLLFLLSSYSPNTDALKPCAARDALKPITYGGVVVVLGGVHFHAGGISFDVNGRSFNLKAASQSSVCPEVYN